MALRQEASNAHAVLLSITDRIHEQRNAKLDFENRRYQLLKVHSLRLDDPLVLAEEKKIERVALLIAPLEQAQEKHRAEWQQAGNLVSALDEFIQALPAGSKVSSYSGLAPSLGDDEDFPQSVERCRRRLRELLADKKKYATAPNPSSRAKEIIRAEIERHAELGRPDVSAVVDHGDPIRWPISHKFKGERLLAARGDDHLDGFAIVTWLFKSQLIDALEKDVDAFADDTAALSATDRAKLLAEVDRDIEVIE